MFSFHNACYSVDATAICMIFSGLFILDISLIYLSSNNGTVRKLSDFTVLPRDTFLSLGRDLNQLILLFITGSSLLSEKFGMLKIAQSFQKYFLVVRTLQMYCRRESMVL